MTWFTILLQCLTGVSVLLGIFVSIRNAFKIQELHLNLNSRLDLLLKATAATSRAEGRAEGVAAERATAVDLLITNPAIKVPE